MKPLLFFLLVGSQVFSQTPQMRKYQDSLDREIARLKKEWEDAYRLLQVTDSILNRHNKIKDTTSLFIVVKHPGALFDADRIHQAELYGAIAVDSIKHGKVDTAFINREKYIWIEDRSKIYRQVKPKNN